MKKILCLILLLAGCWPAVAKITETQTGTCGSKLTWLLTTDGTLTIGGIGKMTLFHKKEDAPWNKYRADIKSLVLLGGPTSIGDNAFIDCSGLTGELVLPAGLTSIGSYAFRGCSGLTGELVLPEELTYIGVSAFRECSSLTGELVLPDGLTDIKNFAFCDCSGLTGLVLPDRLKSIGSSAFSGCTGLTGYLSLPAGLISIGSSAFSVCKGLTGSLSLPDGVTSIGSYAFYGCSGLTGGLVLPERLTSIESSAFKGCSGLTGGLVLPEGLTSIESNTFEGCSGLTGSLSLPDGVTSIGSYAFKGCSGLTGGLVLPEGLTSIKSNTFEGCSGLTGELVLPAGLTSIGSSAFKGCSGLTSLTLSANLVKINSQAFSSCSNLRKIFSHCTTPPQLVGSDAFDDMAKKHLRVPSGSEEAYLADQYWQEFTIVKYITVQTADEAQGKVTGTDTCPYKSETLLEAIPEAGYQFVQWSDGVEDNPRTVTVTRDSLFTAEFEAIPLPTYTVTVFANNNAWGTVSGGGTYEENEEATLKATPNAGYRFVQWDDGETANPRAITVVCDSSFTAEFEEIPAPPILTYTVTVSANNNAWGTVSGDGTYEANAQATLEATPNEGYRFVQWDDGVTDSLRTITVVCDSSFTAEFEAIPTPPEPPTPPIPTYTITVEANHSDWGVVSGGGTYEANAQATLEATPNEGYRFVQWDDGETANPRTITVVCDSSFTAEFEEIPTPPEPPTPPIPTYTITVEANHSDWGVVSGGGTYEANAQATLEAVANEGYRFVKWDDGVTDSLRTITVVCDSSFTAEFEAIPTPPEPFGLCVYPNPSDGLFIVEIPAEATADVYTANGSVLGCYRWDAGRHVLDLRDRAAGTYGLRLTSGKTVWSFKLVVVK